MGVCLKPVRCRNMHLTQPKNFQWSLVKNPCNGIVLVINQLFNWISSIDRIALWQWFTNLPLASKILSVAAAIAPIVALIVNVPKAYSQLRGVVATIEVERFAIVERVPGLVDFQLDLCINAKHGDVVVNAIYLKNKTKFNLFYDNPVCLDNEPYDMGPSDKAMLKLAIPKVDFEFFKLTEIRFQ